jgi:hypothetical protein
MAALAVTCVIPWAKPSPAFGFAEDLCMIVSPNAPRKGKVMNCFDIHCNDDLEFGSFKSLRCTAKQVVQAGLTSVDLVPIRGRSMVHFDATYVIAQALGMSATDAYWVAAYNEAVDQGSYQAYDTAGNGLAAYTTLEIPGVRRTNMPAGGTFFHFVPPVKENVVLDKLDVTSPAEAPLMHVRQWAFGERDTLCRFGLASVPFTNSPGCFQLPQRDYAISYKFPLTSAQNSGGVPVRIHGGEVQLADSPLPADILPLVKIGVYVHTAADRASHHQCTDISPFTRDEDGRFIINFNTTCTQGVHAAQHGLEIGHPELPPRTKLAVELTYDELKAWLEKFPAWRKNKPVNVTREALVADVLDGLRPAKAEDRLAAYHGLWDRYGLCGLPGDEAKDRTCFAAGKGGQPEAKAGAKTGATTGTTEVNASATGGTKSTGTGGSKTSGTSATKTSGTSATKSTGTSATETSGTSATKTSGTSDKQAK